MEHSYAYTKAFIDRETKVLETEIKVDESFKSILANQSTRLKGKTVKPINSRQLKLALDKVNALTKKHVKEYYSQQVIDQIAQQVVKNEHKKMLIINDNLSKINLILVPIIIPEVNRNKKTFVEFSEIIRELPESKYLMPYIDREEISSDEEDEELHNEEQEQQQEEDNEQENTLVQDNQEIVTSEDKYTIKEQLKARKQLKATIRNMIKNKDYNKLLKTYESLRLKLIELDQELNYKMDKLEYLSRLKGDLSNTFNSSSEYPYGVDGNDTDPEIKDSDEEEEVNFEGVQDNLITAAGSSERNLFAELNRFRILVEKLQYKVSMPDQ
ncbi:hypothetical protein CAAN1_12S02960 [[Candida] anglica]|uniref:Uncharacterized protein n=1 Tax=[Candida] anglica TaxID=148631 RepID=A0ABP0E896_9ASCO